MGHIDKAVVLLIAPNLAHQEARIQNQARGDGPEKDHAQKYLDAFPPVENDPSRTNRHRDRRQAHTQGEKDDHFGAARGAHSPILSRPSRYTSQELGTGLGNGQARPSTFMQVRVLFFGRLKDLAGRPSDSLSLPEDATLADLLLHCESRIPGLKDWSHSMAIAINQQYADPQSRLKAGDEVALLPPVSGGSGEYEPSARQPVEAKVRAAIVREPIDAQAIVELIGRPEDGALACFAGHGAQPLPRPAHALPRA